MPPTNRWFTVAQNTSLTMIVESLGLTPPKKWARMIWAHEKNWNVDFRIDLDPIHQYDMHVTGKMITWGRTEVSRKMHSGYSGGRDHYENFVGSTFLRLCESLNFDDSTDSEYRGYYDPHWIILYPGEIIWIPDEPAAPAPTPPATVRREILVFDTKLITEGIRRKPHTRYRVIYPVFVVKIFAKKEDITTEKFILYTKTAKPTGRLYFKKTLSVADDVSLEPDKYIELRYKHAPIDAEYYLDIVTAKGTTTVVVSVPFCGAADEVPDDYAGGVASGSSPIGDESQYEVVLKKAWTRDSRGMVVLKPAEPKEVVKLKYFPLFDTHCHVMSSRCTALPLQWASVRDNSGGALDISGKSREFIESKGDTFSKYSKGKIKGASFIKLGKEGTLIIADKYIKSTEQFFQPTTAGDLFSTVQKYFKDYTRFPISIALPMNLDFAHYWGNFGLPIYLPADITSPGKLFYYFDEYLLVERNTSSGVDPASIEQNILTYDCNLASLAGKFNIEVRDETDKKLSIVEIETIYSKKVKHFLQKISDGNYYFGEDQTKNHMEIAIRYPFQILPFYHYDPRAFYADPKHLKSTIDALNNDHSFFIIEKKADSKEIILRQDNKFSKDYFQNLLQKKLKLNNDAFIENVQNKSGEGLFWGFKMYTRLGFAPDDFTRFPHLADFYKKCVERNIPITCHISPGGMGIADQYIYFREATKLHSTESNTEIRSFWNNKDAAIKSRWEKPWSLWDKDKDFEARLNDRIDIETNLKNGIRYIDEACVHPANWRKVLEKYPQLTICLAHFGGIDFWKEYGEKIEPEKNWNDFRGEIISLINDYPNVYTDISNFTNIKTKDVEWKALPEIENALKKFVNENPRLRERILLGTDWYMTVLAMNNLFDYEHAMFRLLQRASVSDYFGFDAFYQFTVINPLRFLGIVKGTDVDKALLAKHKNFIVNKAKNETWQKQKLGKSLNSIEISNIEYKVEEIFSYLSKIVIEPAVDRMDRLK